MQSALNAANTGTHALENAAHSVSGILGDLDTMIIFATAGTLNPDTNDDSFGGKLNFMRLHEMHILHIGDS